MATAVDMTTYAAYLKQEYVDKRHLFKMDDNKNQLLGLVKKESTWGGENWNAAIEVAGIRGGTANYDIAVANATAGTDDKFVGGWKDRIDVGLIGDKVIRVSQGAGAIDQAFKRKMEGLKKQVQRMTNFQLYRDEGGAVGNIASAATTATGTLTDNTKQVLQFLAPGDVLHFGPNLAGTSLRAEGVTISKIQLANGTFTTTSPVALATQVTSLTANDYIFIAGTSGSAEAGQALAGLQTWVPLDETTAATTLKSVDRSVDTRALAGIRVSATSDSMEESFMEGISQVEMFAGDPNVILCHPNRMSQLKKELAGKISDTRIPGKPYRGASQFGFDGIKIGSNTVVLSDPACQYRVSWCLDLETWALLSVGEWGKLRDYDGKILDRSGKNYQFEMIGYGEFVCYAPGRNAAIIHSTTL